jgi:hypothetical protein
MYRGFLELAHAAPRFLGRECSEVELGTLLRSAEECRVTPDGSGRLNFWLLHATY